MFRPKRATIKPFRPKELVYNNRIICVLTVFIVIRT